MVERSEASRLAVLTAASRILAQRGYDALTIEGIAHEAGVGKQTIYRWWGSKGAVVAECLIEGYLMADRLAIPEGGRLEDDLTAWVGRVFEVIAEPMGQDLVRSLIAAGAENADVGRRVRDSLGGDSTFLARLRAAVDAGELRGDAPLTEIGDALVGTVLLRALSRSVVEDADPRRIVRAILGSNLGDRD